MAERIKINIGDDGEFLEPLPVEPVQLISGVPLFYPDEWQLYLTTEDTLTKQEIMRQVFIPFFAKTQEFFPPYFIQLKSYFHREPLDFTSLGILLPYLHEENDDSFLGILDGDFYIYRQKRTQKLLQEFASKNPGHKKQSQILIDDDEYLILDGGTLASLYNQGKSLAIPVAGQQRVSITEGMDSLNRLYKRMISDTIHSPSTLLTDLFEKSKYRKNDYSLAP